MNDKTFFADVNLPFHVWVRAGDAGGFRWVLREASQRGDGDAPDGALSGPEPTPEGPALSP